MSIADFYATTSRESNETIKPQQNRPNAMQYVAT